MDHLRPAAPKSTKTHKPKVFVSDGKDVPLRGVCCLFTKVADANTVINDQNMIKVLLIDFLLTVKAVTLIFISGCGLAISSAKQGKSGSIYNLVKNK